MQTLGVSKQELTARGSAQKAFELVRAELERVEQQFEHQVRSNIQVIDYLGQYLRASGGKRVRPALLILAAHAAGGDGRSESAIRLATVMEMLHTATLVHDDVIDNAPLRRNRASVNARFGNHSAVLMGDWLYMSAFETSLKERSLVILDILTTLTRKMTEGELIQLTLIGNTGVTENDYFDIVKRKTAYLFSACCEIGAIIAGSNPAEREALRDYGMNLGIAFQIADDLLDITATESQLGKTAGTDLLEGKVTLPLILLQKSDPSVKEILEQIIRDGHSNGLREDLASSLSRHKILETVQGRALDFAAAARKNLELLPQSRYSSALDAIPLYAVSRTS